jgi:hypothetical protein
MKISGDDSVLSDSDDEKEETGATFEFAGMKIDIKELMLHDDIRKAIDGLKNRHTQYTDKAAESYASTYLDTLNAKDLGDEEGSDTIADPWEKIYSVQQLPCWQSIDYVKKLKFSNKCVRGFLNRQKFSRFSITTEPKPMAPDDVINRAMKILLNCMV